MLRTLSLVVVLVAVLIAAPQAGSASTTRSTVSQATRQQIAAQVLTLLNKQRKAHKLKALAMNPKLIVSAHRHNLTMAKIGVLTHQAPGEPVFSARISSAGFHWNAAGENIGFNSQATSSGAQRLEIDMYNEKPPDDGHRLNILSKTFTKVGIDIVIDKHGHLWLTEDFGRPA